MNFENEIRFYWYFMPYYRLFQPYDDYSGYTEVIPKTRSANNTQYSTS